LSAPPENGGPSEDSTGPLLAQYPAVLNARTPPAASRATVRSHPVPVAGMDG